MQQISSNYRIARNTFILYFRMFVMMAIGLYTSRVVINALGVSDYGLYSVVGGLVAMFTFFNGNLSEGTQRFLNFSLGKNDLSDTKKVFSSALTINIIYGVLLFFILEIGGIYMLHYQMNIEPDRFNAAVICFQFSVISVVLSLIGMPFAACVIAHEKMGFYAYTSILDVIFKLLIVYLLLYVETDKLILYSFFYFCTGLLYFFINLCYCMRSFPECGFQLRLDSHTFKDMYSFIGWNTVGCLAAMGSKQGIDILLNMFYNTIMNAANSIANNVNGWISRFVSGFQTAVQPQITKLYAAGQIQDMYNLVIDSCKLSAFLYILLGLPLAIEIETVLDLWLGIIPEHVIVFTRIILIQSLITAINRPLVVSLHAIGKMRQPNLTSGITLLLIVPITYVLLKLNVKVEYIYAVNVIPWILETFYCLYFINKYSGLRTHSFFREVWGKVLMIIGIVFPVLLILYKIVPNQYLRLLMIFATSTILTSLLMYFYGINERYRAKLNLFIVEKISVIKRKKHD